MHIVACSAVFLKLSLILDLTRDPRLYRSSSSHHEQRRTNLEGAESAHPEGEHHAKASLQSWVGYQANSIREQSSSRRTKQHRRDVHRTPDQTCCVYRLQSFSEPEHPIKFDRQFTVWLLPKVDTMNRSIGVGVGKRFMTFQEDAAKVFGLPCTGAEVWDAALDKSESMRQRIRKLIGVDEACTSNMAAAANTLRSMAGRELSTEEEGVFKVSFVVFVVGLICDSKNPGDRESMNFWPALAQPEKIHMFNCRHTW